MNTLKKNLVLTGMMGSGKTTIGKSLSQRLNMQFADIDDIIEKKNGLSISAIFEQRGEKAFRAEEEEESKKAIKSSHCSLQAPINFQKKIISNEIWWQQPGS